MSGWDIESNGDMYRRFDMSESAVGMDCGVVEWVKRSTLRWYGHVMGALEGVLKERSVSMVVKQGIRNSVILPTLSYTSETWTWNAAQQSRIRGVDMSYM